MKILVANLGSTSFKYRLIDMSDERQLAIGGIERIGDKESPCFVEIDGRRRNLTVTASDHAEAVRICLAQLTDAETGCLQSADEVSAIGLKAVHGGRVSGVQRVTSDVLSAMEEMDKVAPAHNPPYVAAMRQLAERLPDIPLVAAFETGFHTTVPDRLRYYAIPRLWGDRFHVQRWGFHGASHRYISERIAQLLGRSDLKIISMHLGGSSSLCAIQDGKSVQTSMGMSPQTGLPHNNRIGDFDPFALPVIMKATGKSLDEVLDDLACRSGLLGLSGKSGDIRDLETLASEGDADARLALDVFISETRRWMGGLLVELGSVDAIVFTAGIGENSKNIRSSICRDLESLGIVLDPAANDSASGETPIHASESKTEIWVVPTNEEIIVARQVKQYLESSRS